MLDALDYWSADARGGWTTGDAGLGHLLLRTTSSPHEALPLTDHEAGITITGDCRLDNRDDVAGRLGVGAAELAGWSDARLVLCAYRQWGEQCVAHLLGDFAFAVWDSRRRQLFGARDRFGVKPLYYYERGGLFAFASEMKGLLALSAVDRTVNETWIADYIHRLGLDNTGTFFAGMR
jgi:asparagine synthase (glutamine-hydrolysing)